MPGYVVVGTQWGEMCIRDRYVHHLCASSVLGRDGNKEFVMHLKHTETHKVFPIRDIVKNYTVKR